MKSTLKLLNKYIFEFIVSIRRHDIYLKILLTLLIFFWIFYLSTNRFRKKTLDLKVGDIATYDTRVEKDIEYVDEIKTESKRKEAVSKISPVFRFDLDVLEKEKKKVDDYFDKVREIDNEYSYLDEKVEAARKSKLLKDQNLLKILFLNYKLNNFHFKTKEILNKIYKTGLTDLTYENIKSLSKTGYIAKIYYNEQGEKISIRAKINDIYYKESINYTDIVKQNYDNLRWDKIQFLKTYIQNYIKPNLFFDKKVTGEKIVNALNLIKPVIKKLKKGQIIVRYGEEIKESHFEIIKEILKYSTETNVINGYFVILLAIFSLSFLLLKFFSAHIFNNSRTFFFLLSFIFLSTTLNYFFPNINNFLKAKVMNSFFIPIGGFAILINQLIGYPVSIFVLLIISILTVFLIGFNFIDFIVILSIGLSALLLSKVLKKRIYMWYLGIIIGLFYFILNIGTARINNFTGPQVLNSILIGFINGIISVIIGMGLYPLFETLFNMLTEYKLLELSDLNLPIMKKLLIEAPGTYNHSILIANMAETAALDIGANSILARVGGYYHDIGKLENPEYFIENQSSASDKHKKIKPSISSSIIKSHVKYGMELAKKLKLPEEIIKTIHEHHGTTTIFYFYQKALQEKNEQNLNKDDLLSTYRYEGPKPSSKETAIIMLADAVEAASRSLKKPSYSRLENIVRELINERFLSGQLDNCPLTLIDLNKITNSFSHVLAAMYHTRIEYPEKEEVEKLENEY